ncbi:MAG: ABC transporter permease subunit [Candidatus Bathyarchaeia archaeon]|jgi:ABC-type transport system involved in multi-copper enzyme maturation permease subunit
MEKNKGKPFLEALSSALHEDYRFPIFEIFAFLYVVGTFAFANFGGAGTAQSIFSSQIVAYRLTTSLLGASSGMSIVLFILVLVILKNIAYGLGSDLEKGVIQTYFSYPLKRYKLLTAKLISALGVSIGLFLVIQILAFYILAPDVVSHNLGVVLLSYAGNLSFPLIIAGILLLITLVIKRGSPALVAGILLFFAFFVGTQVLTSVAGGAGTAFPLQLLSVLSPQIALQYYYPAYTSMNALWAPTFTEVTMYLGASYALVTVLFGLGYYYFTRRLHL